MSNISIALSLILSVETPNMDSTAIGDLHLPAEQRAHGRFQMRQIMIDDLNEWSKRDGFKWLWTTADAHNPKLDTWMAYWWLTRKCGHEATVSEYCRTWNGGRKGRNSAQAKAYYRRCLKVKRDRPEHFEKCKHEVERMMK